MTKKMATTIKTIIIIMNGDKQIMKIIRTLKQAFPFNQYYCVLNQSV